MKTNQQPTYSPRTIEEAINGNKTHLKPTVKELTLEWATKQRSAQESDGGNFISKEFAQVALMIIDSFEDKYFSLKDFIFLSNYLDLPQEEVTTVFNTWISFLQKRGCVQLVRENIYDWKSYTFLKQNNSHA